MAVSCFELGNEPSVFGKHGRFCFQQRKCWLFKMGLALWSHLRNGPVRTLIAQYYSPLQQRVYRPITNNREVQ
jgi:hypothetical protein